MSFTYDGLTYSSMGNVPKQSDKSFQFLLVRLITGTASVSNGRQKAKQTIDFSTLPSSPQVNAPSKALPDFLLAYSVGGDQKRFIKVTSADNRKFYQDLLAEFGSYFIHSQRGSHTAAFVFLYRILEKISFSVPLLYCSTQRDYVGTFNELKALFDSKVKGELGLFKKFLNQGRFIDQVKLDVEYTINFESEQGHENSYFKLATKHCDAYSDIDEGAHQLKLPFRKVPELLITLRNRFFHSLVGEDKHNIRLEEILHPDEFFSNVNPIFCSFLSIVALQTIASKYQA